MDYNEIIMKHYKEFWGEFTEHKFNKGPINELPMDFKILRFAPNSKRNMWTYATCGMSTNKVGVNPIEIHIFAPSKNDFLIELLTIIVHYHVSGGDLGLGHTINFGCSWYGNSKSEYGLISLPYLDGPLFEILQVEVERIQFLWLIPITETEVEYKKKNGLEALEEKFEENHFNYLDPYREGVV